MRIFTRLAFLSVFLVFLLVTVSFSISGELIEPTRTIQGSEKAIGRISVFSEPPGLDVFLNNSKVGKTPIVSIDVEAGPHNLKVKDSKKEIYVMPGKSLRLSLHKGGFIEIPEIEREIPQKSEKNNAEKRESTEPVEKKKGYKPIYEPFYWPMNPSGPIEVKQNDQ